MNDRAANKNSGAQESEKDNEMKMQMPCHLRCYSAKN